LLRDFDDLTLTAEARQYLDEAVQEDIARHEKEKRNSTGGLAKACSCRCVMWPAYGKLRKSANDGTAEAKSFPGLLPP
jgi:hypothetical protein